MCEVHRLLRVRWIKVFLLTSCGFSTVAAIETEFARQDLAKLENYNLIL